MNTAVFRCRRFERVLQQLTIDIRSSKYLMTYSRTIIRSPPTSALMNTHRVKIERIDLITDENGAVRFLQTGRRLRHDFQWKALKIFIS